MEIILHHAMHIPRPIRFVLVGGVCTGIQWVFLFSFVEIGLEEHLSNAMGFILSTQTNFFLTYHVTHWDRRGGRVWRKFRHYNFLAITVLAGNMLVFSLALKTLPIPYLLAGVISIGGTLLGVGVNYTVGLNHIFTPPITTDEPISHPSHHSEGEGRKKWLTWNKR